ncbi:MAG: U32 family peptidase [Christensenellales bacterium]
MELLSPAGNGESLINAVKFGADAVYLGLEKFNARIKADNFTRENLSSWVDYCHIRGVKVYLTLNTLIFESELEEVFDLVKFAVKCNVDAFIIADFAVLEFVKRIKCNVPVHFSTQVGINNAEGAAIAKRLGASRVILARETPLEEIRRIISSVDIEVEVFVHGAICSAFSGNCELSYFDNGNSGNRGKCKQLCRLKYYSSLSGKDEYYMSPRDLCLINKIKILKEIGVASVKIEGRLKGSDYVAAVTNAYRRAIDGNFSEDDVERMKIAFNRGDFTEGYIQGADNIIEPKIQNHIGIRIGTVQKTKKNNGFYEIYFDSDRKLKKGDGVKFVRNKTEEWGAEITDDKTFDGLYKVYSSKVVSQGCEVRLTKDSGLSDEMSEYSRKMDVDFTVNLHSDENCTIMAKYDDIEVKKEFNRGEKSKNKDFSYEQIKKSFAKISPFRLRSLNFSSNETFLPMSTVNSMRRETINAVVLEILNKYKKSYTDSHLSLKEYSLSAKNVRFSVCHSESDILKCKDDFIVLIPDDYSENEVGRLLDVVGNKTVLLNIPSFLIEKDIRVLYKTLEIYNTRIHSLLINNISGIFIAEKFRMKYSAGPGLNISNSISSHSFDYDRVFLSVEVDVGDRIGDNVFIWSSDYPLMNYIYCPVKAITNCSCANCMYNGNIEYGNGRKKYSLFRYKLDRCYFLLYNKCD